MAARAAPTATSMARVNSMHSSLGTVAPLNTPTRRFYGKQDRLQTQAAGVPNPNVYVVQPFKNASLPKDLIYAKKNAPNPGEALLNSTIQLINHFTSCYETVKHQLQDEHTKERDSALLFSRTMFTGDTNNTTSRNTLHRPAKQARLRPLGLHQNEKDHRINSDPFTESCVGISPVPVTKSNDLTQIYDEKLRVLRKLKPEFFDSQGNLLSKNPLRSHSYKQTSAPSSKKSAITSSFRTPHNTVLTGDNAQFDDRRTFLTEFTNEEEDNQNNQGGEKTLSFTSTQQPNSLNEYMKRNYVIKVLDIKTVTNTSAKRDRTKSASDKNSFISRKGNMTNKS